MASLIYLDNNATTAPLPEVVEVVARLLSERFGNPGSRHQIGRRARQVLEESRESICDCLGADPTELVFTSGGTEANNLAIHGLTQGTPGTIVLSPGQHPSVVEVCRDLATRGWKLHELPVDRAGRLISTDLPDDTRLVAILLAHNETGVIQDVDSLSQICRQRRIPLHLDAVQAVGKIPVHFHRLGAATLSFGAHKFHGPRGVGGLLVRSDVRLAKSLFGGHQESDRRPGTEPVALVAGMATALQRWQSQQPSLTVQITQLRDSFQELLTGASLEGAAEDSACPKAAKQWHGDCAPAVVNGIGTPRLPNTLNISFPGVDGEALLVALDLEGIACSLGTTCASGSSEPAPILLAMGMTADLYRSAVRFSLSYQNTPDELDEAALRIARVVSALRKSDR